MRIFPIIQPSEASQSTELPLCREVAWDYENNKPIYKNGLPVEVTGKEAVKVWIWKALQTTRFRHEIYTWAYGSDYETLIGQAYTDELKEAEAPRYLRECLLINPYITTVKNNNVDFEAGRLTVEATAVTVYGEVPVYASV